MKNHLLYFLVIVIFLSTACKHKRVEGAGETSRETRNVQAFSSVQVDASVKVVINIDSNAQPGLELSGYKNLLSHIKTEVKGSRLRIYTDEPTDFDTDKDIIATITVRSLESFAINGAAEAEFHGHLLADKFTLDVKGAGDVVVDYMEVNNFVADLAGAGNLTIQNGRIGHADYKVAGAGSVDAFSVMSDNVKAVVLGAGDMKVNVSQQLDAEIKGAGSIDYKGHPIINKNIMGVGEIEDAN